MPDLNTEQANLKEANRKERANNLTQMAALKIKADEEAFRHTQSQETQRKLAEATTKPVAATPSTAAPVQRPVAPALNPLAITAKLFSFEDEAESFHNAVLELARDLDGIQDKATREILQQAIVDSEADIQQSVDATQALSARGPVEVVVAQQPDSSTSAPALTPSPTAARSDEEEESEAVSASASPVPTAPVSGQAAVSAVEEPVILGTFRSGKIDQKTPTPVTQVVFLVGKDDNFANVLTKTAIAKPDVNLLLTLSILATIGKRAPKVHYAQDDIEQVLGAVARFSARLRGPVIQDDYHYVSTNGQAFVNNMIHPVISVPASRIIPGFGAE